MTEKLEINGESYDDEYDILSGEEFKRMGGKELEDEHRWFNLFSQVVNHKPSGRFFKIYFYENASESQEGQELEPYTFEEVFPVEKTITVYEPKAVEGK